MAIKVGIVGLGDGGMSNYRSLKTFSEVRIVAVCDTDREKFDNPELPEATWRDYDLIVYQRMHQDVLAAAGAVKYWKPLHSIEYGCLCQIGLYFSFVKTTPGDKKQTLSPGGFSFII